MKKGIIKYIIFTLALVLGAAGLAETGMFTVGEALLRAVTLFVIVNIFLVLRFLFGWLKNTINTREMKNSKYRETDSDE